MSSALLALGAGLIYAGSSHLFFSDRVYSYKSDGIILEGESKEIFRDPLIPRGADNEQAMAIVNRIQERLDEDYLQLSSFAGEIFNVPAEGGSRTYYLQTDTEIDPWQNKAIVFIGLFVLVFGVIGLVLEKKLSRYQ